MIKTGLETKIGHRVKIYLTGDSFEEETNVCEYYVGKVIGFSDKPIIMLDHKEVLRYDRYLEPYEINIQTPEMYGVSEPRKNYIKRRKICNIDDD